MATLTEIPASLQQGDSYDLVLSFSDYPASAGWSLVLSVGGKTQQQWTSTASGDAHALSLSTTSTAALLPGSYRYSLRAKNGAKAETFETGPIEILADLSLAADGSLESYADQMLAICREARKNILAGETKLYMIGGRQMQFLSLAELAKEEAHWRREKAAERRGSSFQKRAVTFVRG